MKRSLLAILASIVVTVPASAVDTASLRLVAYVPVDCSIDILDAHISGRQLIMMVRRNCNTGHRLVIDGSYDEALGDMTFRYNENSIAAGNGAGSIAQPEAYYDGLDRLIIESSDGNADELSRYAQSLSLILETA